MKKNRLFMMLLAALTLGACTNDDLITEDNNRPTFEGDKAYMSIRLADAGGFSRTTELGGFEYGTDEQAVKSAHFYFFDSEGVFVTYASAWDGGQPTAKPGESETYGNIEFTSNTVVVLKNLQKKAYPKYMVTVLNQQKSYDGVKNLSEMEKALAADSGAGIVNSETTGEGADAKTTHYFTMSTSSYKRSATNTVKNYFVTELKDDNFFDEPITLPLTTEQEKNIVTVHVERLAAKVTLNVHATELNDQKVTNTAGDVFYKLETTVAGEDNAAAPSTGSTTTLPTAKETLYIKFLGWQLNATAKQSYIVKNLSPIWNETTPFANWNDANFYRSYWGMAYNYDKTDAYIGDNSETLVYNKYLDYVDGKAESTSLIELGKSGYCAENTNSTTNLTHFPSTVTSILLKAQIFSSTTATNGTDMVRYNGVLFTEESYLKYVLNALDTRNQLNYYTKSGETYTQLNENAVELVDAGNGIVLVDLKNAETIQLYKKNDNNVSQPYSPIVNSDDNSKPDNSEIRKLLKEFTNSTSDAIGYKNGVMYYTIPIEHYNPATTTTNTGSGSSATTTIPETKYGVVRNHHYVLTINELEHVGKGIFDPDEEVVPLPEDKTTYYVGAQIKILSWKLVNQNVGI